MWCDVWFEATGHAMQIYNCLNCIAWPVAMLSFATGCTWCGVRCYVMWALICGVLRWGLMCSVLWRTTVRDVGHNVTWGVCDVVWCDVNVIWALIYGVVWCDVMWCDVMWCDVKWHCGLMCGVMWRLVRCVVCVMLRDVGFDMWSVVVLCDVMWCAWYDVWFGAFCSVVDMLWYDVCCSAVCDVYHIYNVSHECPPLM